MARAFYPDKDVTLIRREEKAMIPCGIPYIFSSLGGNVDKDVLPDTPLEKRDVKIVVDEVKEVDRCERVVKTASGREIKYDRLILATGSRPSALPIPGSDLGNVFYVYKDYKYLSKMVSAVEEADSIVIIGGGFIGCEFADELSKMGKKVTIVELLDHCLATYFDPEFCSEAEAELSKRGIEIITGTKVTKIVGDEKVKSVRLVTGKEIPADLVIISVGAKPNTDLARSMKLAIGESGAIAVDDFMRTSDPLIFAVGDCAEKRDFFTGKPVRLMLASAAVSEARTAVANLYKLNTVRARS